MTITDGFLLAQKDGEPPAVSVSADAPGDSGISVVRMRFQGGAHISATAGGHLVWFLASPHARLECRLEGRALLHDATSGALAICPAGMDCAADADESVDSLLIAVEPEQLEGATASTGFEAQVTGRLSGRDEALFDLAQRLALECSAGYPNGPLFWHELASGFLGGMV